MKKDDEFHVEYSQNFSNITYYQFIIYLNNKKTSVSISGYF